MDFHEDFFNVHFFYSTDWRTNKKVVKKLNELEVFKKYFANFGLSRGLWSVMDG